MDNRFETGVFTEEDRRSLMAFGDLAAIALERLRAARGTSNMPDAAGAAARVLSVLDELKVFASGSFIDIREILDPEEHARLYRRPR